MFSLLPPAFEWLQLCPPSVCALLRMHSMRERARMSAATHATCARALSAYIHRGQRWALGRPLFGCYLIWQSAGGARRRLRECQGVTREPVHAGTDGVKLCLRRIMTQCRLLCAPRSSSAARRTRRGRAPASAQDARLSGSKGEGEVGRGGRRRSGGPLPPRSNRRAATVSQGAALTDVPWPSNVPICPPSARYAFSITPQYALPHCAMISPKYVTVRRCMQ